MWYWVCFKIFCGCSVWVAAVVPQQVVWTQPLSACAFAQIFLVAVRAVGAVQAEAEGVCYVFFILAPFVLSAIVFFAILRKNVLIQIQHKLFQHDHSVLVLLLKFY